MAKKRIIAAILLAVFTLGGTGCMAFQFRKTIGPNPDANDQALAYMEKKYGEAFTYAAPWGSSMTGTREFLATCDSLPGLYVLVQSEGYQEDDPVFRDNYLAVKYQAKTVEYFRDLAAGIFGDANVYHEASKQSLSSELPADTTFETFYTDSSTVIIATIELRESSYSSRQQLEELLSKLDASQGDLMITVIVVEDSVYGTLDRRGLDQLISRKEAIISVYARTQDGTFHFNWPEVE